VPAAGRQRILRDPPDLLLSTPESLEAMLVSRNVEERQVDASGTCSWSIPRTRRCGEPGETDRPCRDGMTIRREFAFCPFR
jgi:hypothetical protein